MGCTHTSSRRWQCLVGYAASSRALLPLNIQQPRRDRQAPFQKSSYKERDLKPPLPLRYLLHFHYYVAAAVTTPSYSRDAIYSSVRWKCRFGISIVADSWFDCRFEWMSSMRPLRYLIVTYPRSVTAVLLRMITYSLILLIKVIDVAIQDLNEKLHGYGSVHAGVRNTKSTL